MNSGIEDLTRSNEKLYEYNVRAVKEYVDRVVELCLASQLGIEEARTMLVDARDSLASMEVRAEFNRALRVVGRAVELDETAKKIAEFRKEVFEDE